MPIKVPFIRGSKADPLRRVIRDAANKTALPDELVSILFTHLFEGIAREMSMGNAVRVPCFGMFAPVRWEPRKADLDPYAVPYFCASRGLRAEIRATCSPFPSSENEFNTYRKSHRCPGAASTKRVFTGMEKWREIIQQQCKKLGIELEPGS